MSVRSWLSDLFNERTHFDFVGSRRKWFVLSAALILIGLVSLATRGLDLGIEFQGGTAWQVQVQDRAPSTGTVRQLLAEEGLTGAQIVILGRDTIRVQAERVSGEQQRETSELLAAYARAEVDDVSVTDVGPTWGEDVSRKAIQALVVFFIAIAAYMSLRFEPKMAAAGLIAVTHDLLFAVGVYSLSGFEVTPATVIAFLTILGFSLYDTVVVFDKVKENVSMLAPGGRETYSDVVNRSMNSVLMRSINTSISSALPIFSLLFIGAYMFGALTIREFALALGIGVIVGTYSSIFIATPVLAVFKEREPRYRALRQRIATRRAAEPGAAAAESAPVRSAVTTAAPGPEPTEVGAVPSRPPLAVPRPGGGAPRGRQQRRKRR